MAYQGKTIYVIMRGADELKRFQGTEGYAETIMHSLCRQNKNKQLDLYRWVDNKWQFVETNMIMSMGAQAHG